MEKFLQIINFNKIMILKIFYILGSFFLFIFESHAFFWKPKSFDECILSKMKGVDQNQLGNVENICFKEFPTLPNFTNVNFYGVLNCTDQWGRKFNLNIKKENIGSFKIKKRTNEYIEATKDDAKFIPEWEIGVDLELNLLYGSGAVLPRLKPASNVYQSFNFSCKQ